jgi:hypothetical protein
MSMTLLWMTSVSLTSARSNLLVHFGLFIAHLASQSPHSGGSQGVVCCSAEPHAAWGVV